MKFSGMLYHHPRTNRLDFESNQVKGQGQGHKKVKNYWTKLHEIIRDDLSSSKQLIKFWERSGQRSRSKSQKGQKHIFVITHSVFVRFICNQRQNVHFSIPSPLIWWQMWRWCRYALYQVPFLVIIIIITVIIIAIIINTTLKRIFPKVLFTVVSAIFFFLFFFLSVTTITLERLNQSKPNFHTWLLTEIARPSSRMGIAGHM